MFHLWIGCTSLITGVPPPNSLRSNPPETTPVLENCMSRLRFLTLAVIVFSPFSLVQGQREFGFDNSKPSGQPYLAPQESVKRLKVPPGWEVKVFAAEPQIINPIAFTIDERGRLWVVENFEYPKP